jgi:hypothetical protein
MSIYLQVKRKVFLRKKYRMLFSSLPALDQLVATLPGFPARK